MTRTPIRYAKESSVESGTVSDALRLGVISLKMASRTDTGWPDRVFLLPGGRPLFIEFKRPGEVPRALQEHRRDTLKALGYNYACCDSRESAMAYIAAALEASRRTAQRG